MTKTPRANRPHITIFGETNSGKSALFNALLGAKQAIVSPVAGTTTDPVGRPMELIPFGAVYLTDTAGLNDASVLGKARMAKTRKALDSADLAVYVIDIQKFDGGEYRRMINEFTKRETIYITVFTKNDIHGERKIKDFAAEQTVDEYVIVSTADEASIENLRGILADKLAGIAADGETLLGGIAGEGDTVAAVITIDGEAPKGRLILPQVQFIRECVDRGVTCVVTTPARLAKDYNENISLVVVDSQSFGEAAAVLPHHARLTSFSVLMSRAKGDIKLMAEGIAALPTLNDGARVLIAEACAHSVSHEDIGRTKIPSVLKKVTGKTFEHIFISAGDFPENLSEYAYIVHCGGCMITRKEMLNRLRAASCAGVPITNYGLLLAHGSNILRRALQCCKLEL
jgi:[FeFe] hydrogenase H-cluster maturation GTPase HydF